jgi:cytochrome c
MDAKRGLDGVSRVLKIRVIAPLCAPLLLVAACASAPVSTSSAKRPAAEVAVERGRDLAELRCGGCHGLGLYGESPRSPSTPFRDMRRGMTALSFQQRMETIAEGRHYDMPKLGLTAGEANDIAAYIESLELP